MGTVEEHDSEGKHPTDCTRPPTDSTWCHNCYSTVDLSRAVLRGAMMPTGAHCLGHAEHGSSRPRCDPRYNNKVSVNRWLILARNCKVSVTDCSIQQGIIRFLWLIVDFTKELQGFPWEYEENLDPKRSQIGLRCSETRKCSQRFGIDHFLVRDLVSYSNSEILL